MATTRAGTSYGSYGQDDKPVLEQETIEGHAVRATLLCAGLVAVANVDGREDYLAEAQRLWENMVQRRMYVTGGLGAVAGHEGFGPDYVLPNNGYLETCAAVGAGFFHHNLSLALADARYADELERVLYNSVLSGVSLKGDTYFYENPLEGGEEPETLDVARLPVLSAHVPQNHGCSAGLHLRTGDQGARLRESVYRQPGDHDGGRRQSPVDADLSLSLGRRDQALGRAGEGNGVCHERAPARLVRSRGCTVNGKPLAPSEKVRGYAHLQRKWRRGDVIELSLPMPVQRIKANPKVEADIGPGGAPAGPPGLLP